MAGNDNRFGVEPPRDANGKAAPLDAETLYSTDGQAFHVDQFRYLAKVNRRVAYGVYEHTGKLLADNTPCFLLTPPDSWEKLEEDALKGQCSYFGASGNESATCANCRHSLQATGRRCLENMHIDLVKRAKKLAGAEEQEGER